MDIHEFYNCYEWESCDECNLPAVLGIDEDDIKIFACWEHGLDLLVDDFGDKVECAVEVPWLDNKETTD